MALKIVKSSSLAPNREQLIGLGHRAFAVGDLEAAATHFLAALELDAKDATLFVQLGVVLLQQEKYDKAVVALRQALELDPYLVDGLNALGVVMFKLEWFAAAEVFFRRVLELDPVHPAAKQSLVETIRKVQETKDTIHPDLDYLTKLARPTEPTLSLCMIVKNEEKYLEGCLQSVQGIVDEIVIVDTGSTDDTIAIAERFGAKIYHFPWIGDFAAARNVSLEHATSDWILVMDADERLETNAKAKLSFLKRQQDVVGYSVVVENFLGNEEGEGTQLALIYRMFRNRPDVRFEGIVHEQVGPSAGRTGMKSHSCDLKIIHYGYLQHTMKDRAKNERNLELLRRQESEDPGNPYVYFQLGQTLKLMGNLEEAERNYARARELLKEKGAPLNLPYYPNVYYSLGDLNRRAKRYDQAIAYLEEGVELFPSYPDAIFTLGLVYLDQERWSEAIPYFERCQALAGTVHAGGTDPSVTTYKGLNALGVCYSKLGETKKAIDHLERAIARHPNPDSDLHANLGVLLVQENQPAKATEHFVAALERNPKDLRSWINLGTLSFRFGRYQESIEAWDKALEIDAALVDALIPKAESLLKLGDVDAARTALEEVLAHHPDSRSARLNLSLVHLLTDRTADAQAIYGRYPEDAECRSLSALGHVLSGGELPGDRPSDADLARVWAVFADLALAAKRPDQIECLLSVVDQLQGKVAGLEIELGKACQKRHEFDTAVQLFIRAQQRSPMEPSPYIALGDVCRATNNLEDARVMFAKACELAPEATYPRRQLALLGSPAGVAERG